jgi:hypothetical protein
MWVDVTAAGAVCCAHDVTGADDIICTAACTGQVVSSRVPGEEVQLHAQPVQGCGRIQQALPAAKTRMCCNHSMGPSMMISFGAVHQTYSQRATLEKWTVVAFITATTTTTIITKVLHFRPPNQGHQAHLRSRASSSGLQCSRVLF